MRLLLAAGGRLCSSHQHIRCTTDFTSSHRNRERIRSDGTLQIAELSTNSSRRTNCRPSGVPLSDSTPATASAVPEAPPLDGEQLEQLVRFVQSCSNLLVVTGAGASTETGLRDYRGPGGAYKTGFKPMTHQQFMFKPEHQARYWARSFVGWRDFATATTSGAHEGLARLQSRGWVRHIITQNVDRLHHKAGSQPVLELHGTTHEVVCMDCGAISCRHELQDRMAAANPEAAAQAEAIHAAAAHPVEAGTAASTSHTTVAGMERVPVRRPDGDVELQDAGVGFRVPPCTACGGHCLKPNVVFFGANVDGAVSAAATQLAQECDGMLVVGSSLMVFSAFRLAKAVATRGVPLMLLTVGETRADSLAQTKLEARAGETLLRLASHPDLLLPNVS